MANKTKKDISYRICEKTIKIKATKDKVWRKISNIVGLPTWVVDVKKTTYLSNKKKGWGQYDYLRLMMETKLKNT